MATSPDRLVAGLIGDRYEITGLIASGGMGSVYRARDTVLDRTVALKVLRTGTEGEDFVRRFRTEATNAARLSHPNIVQVYDFGYADDSPYMAMEFVDGQTLREVIQSKRVLRADLAARIASAVAAALEHARRQGIVHRDIKPENILLTTDGQVKVADFGLSHALAEVHATQTGTLLGTAHYLAPEQVAGGRVDHRTDLYALGIVLFEMLTGQTPFTGDTPVVIAYRRVNEDVPSALAINPAAPSALDAIVGRAAARDPQDRFPTAQHMIDALRDAAPRSDTDDLGGLVHHTAAIPIAGHETIQLRTRRDRTRGRLRRRRVIALVAVLGLLAAGVLVMTGPFARATVPAVASRTADEARAMLTEAGFVVAEDLQASATVPKEVVIAQVPGPDTRVKPGSVVRLIISSGPQLIAVPAVKGDRFTAAERALRTKGFAVRRIDIFHNSVERLRVVRQEHSAGTVLEEGTTVTLWVSKGPEMIQLPGVKGRSEESATRILTDAGFRVEVERVRHGSIPAGEVISQSPKKGARLAKRSTVSIVVSLGPPLVKAPNLECMTKRQAEDALVGRGLKVKFSGSGGRVVDQEPAPASRIPEGTTVTAFMGLGSFC